MVQQKTRNTGYVYDDGGRSQYFTGKAGDCVVRAVSIATGRDYKEVYKAAAKVIGYTPRNGIQHKDTKKVLLHFGGVWHPTMGIGTGCRVHLKADELPTGRIVCNCSRHLATTIFAHRTILTASRSSTFAIRTASSWWMNSMTNGLVSTRVDAWISASCGRATWRNG